MSFHQRLRKGPPLITTFVKTPHHMVIEVLGATGIDAILLDAEHSVFGPAELDRAILAARSTATPVLVRIPDDRPSSVLQVLDMGADGVIVPHISTAEQARLVVQSARYGIEGRGFATTNRAGAFGRTKMPEHLKASSEPTVIVQIEDPDAVDNIDSITDVDGLSGVFIGPADLAVAYGENDITAPRVIAAVDHVISVAGQKNVPIASYAAKIDAAKGLIKKGMTLVVLATEHTAMQEFFSEDKISSLRF
ncbi:HpcH/HpaI aldolase family protein [Sulfitobacter dubius]|uniref:HpcH/HpaI aldolase family protein n=1 Tax=Sulfitobacter dubius TaxID=218673 RepID=UPI0008E35DD8|nr:aldolase/citrate lyase family protein [Sulfitobacter dubius]SFH38463.1 2-keto-3-deoxy-L-rhamnonate aldolase RhmA [Sulfitobacter dubius]